MLGDKKFLDMGGNFDSAPFIQLLHESKQAIKSGKKASIKSQKKGKTIIIGGINPKEIWGFINRLGNFLNSGIDIKTAFGILTKQVKNPKLQECVEDIRINLNYGLSVSDTLKQYTRYFDPLVISLIEVGEKTGGLPKVLTELDKKLLDQIELKARIKGAMIYPTVLVVITLVMVTFMVTFILPKITETFVKSGVELPWLTQILINISDFIIGHYIILIISIIGCIVGFILFKRTRVGKIVLGHIALKVPVFGYIVKQSNTILFVNSLSLLLDSGVLVLDALETSAKVVTNIHYKSDIIRIKNEVEVGIKLSSAMGLHQNGEDVSFFNPFFNEDLVHMISVGEETGTISKSVDKIGKTYNDDLRRYIGNLMTLLEPFIIVFIGSLVGTIVIAIMLPFFDLVKVAKKL